MSESALTEFVRAVPLPEIIFVQRARAHDPVTDPGSAAAREGERVLTAQARPLSRSCGRGDLRTPACAGSGHEAP